MDELLQTRLQTINDLNRALNEQTAELCMIHGDNDPHMVHIVASAFTMSIKDIDGLAPGFKNLMRKMLED